MDIIDKLTDIFKEFPGIGERQARRFVYFLMAKDNDYSQNLIKLVGDIKKNINQCEECFKFYIDDNQKNTCPYCSSSHRDSSLLLVVEKDSDLESIEKSRIYKGKYFVLGGLVPIVEKNTKNKVRVNELISLINRRPNLKEVILAFTISPQGDHTDFYIREQIKNTAQDKQIKISSLGRGLSTGTELEYSDNDTLKNALQNRQ